MKKILIPAIAFALFSCVSHKNTILKSGEYSLESTCPEAGICSFEVSKDSSLVYKQSDLGKLYYETAAQPGKTILKYNYTKKTNPELQDDFYRENVIIETDSDISKLDKNTDIKMLFEVSCYCKGLAGFYKVEGGYAEYKDGKLLITVPEVIDNQLTKYIVADIK